MGEIDWISPFSSGLEGDAGPVWLVNVGESGPLHAPPDPRGGSLSPIGQRRDETSLEYAGTQGAALRPQRSSPIGPIGGRS